MAAAAAVKSLLAKTVQRPFQPYVLLSYAQSLDGSIASGGGVEQLLLSGSASMELTHRLRAGSDAVCVGIGTVLADDPRLTVRLPPPSDSASQPAAVVFDSELRTPLGENMLENELGT